MSKDVTMQNNLTTGSVPKTLLRFSLPYLLSYFLQTLYGLADLFIIGRFDRVEATTAVSVGSQVMHMVTVMIVGLAMGTTVMVGRAVGAADHAAVKRIVGNTVTLFALLSLAGTAVLLCLTRVIVAAVSTPVEAVAGTRAYLIVCFIGVPFITAYNVISSILRGSGDSKTPLYLIAVACVLNILLDLLFVGGLGLGAPGAALATVLAQTFSVLLSLLFLVRKKADLLPAKSDYRLQSDTVSELLKIGVPIALQDGFVQIAFLVITAIANSRGLTDAAAVGIVEKIIGVLFLVPSSMLSSVSVLAAQNFGAQKPERAKLTLRFGLLFVAVWGLLAVVVMQVAADWFVGLFTESAEVARMGGEYMRGYVFDCLIAGIHFCFSGYFCACGLSLVSFLHNAASILCARIPLAYLASVRFPNTLLPMGLATTTGSMLSVLICVAVYAVLCQKERTNSRKKVVEKSK